MRNDNERTPPLLRRFLQVRRGSRVVELRGFEPLTFSLRTRRATNCATAPERRSNRRETKRYHPRERLPNRPRQEPTARRGGLHGLALPGLLGSAAWAAISVSAAVCPEVQVPGSPRSMVRTVRCARRLGDVRRQGDRQRVPQRAAVLGGGEGAPAGRRPGCRRCPRSRRSRATRSRVDGDLGDGRLRDDLGDVVGGGLLGGDAGRLGERRRRRGTRGGPGCGTAPGRPA